MGGEEVLKVNIIVNKGYSYRKLLKKSNKFYGIPIIFRKSIIVPPKYNHMLYIHQYGVDVEILDSPNIEADVIQVRKYIEDVFRNETIGLRGMPQELCLLNDIEGIKIINMGT